MNPANASNGNRKQASTSPWKRGWRRLTRVWRSDTLANVDAELRFHFEQKVAEFEAQGMNTTQARMRAEEEFGDVQSVRESLTEIDGRVAKRQQRAQWWEAVAQDFRYLARSLRRSPAFTATVVVTLALGLGANAALFSVLDRLYVQEPGGVTQVEQVRRVYRTFKNPSGPVIFDRFQHSDIRAFHDLTPDNVAFAGYYPKREPFGRNDGEVGAAYVEGGYFAMLGVRPALGRFFTVEEARIEGLSLVAVLSHSLWQRKFAGDSAVIGRTIEIASHPYVIVGVAAKEFVGLDLDAAEIWLPRNTWGTLQGRDPNWFEKEGSGNIRIVMRGSEASQMLFAQRATQFIRQSYKLPSDTPRVFVRPVVEARNAENYGKELSISTRLAGVSLVIFLIAAANVGNLMLARAASREREIALRVALGVSRRRLLMQLLLESLTLAAMASVASLLVAQFGATMLRRLLFPDINWGVSTIDWRVALFTAVLAMIAGIVAGLFTAYHASRPNLVRSLKASARDGGRRSSSLRSSLIIAQAALSVVLLVGSGAFVRSLKTVEQIDTGYDIERLVFASVGYDRELGDRRAEILQRMPEAVERIRAIANVEHVAMSEGLPMSGFSMKQLTVPGRDSLPAGKQLRLSVVVSPEYFRTVGTRLLQGRFLSPDDRKGTEPVLVIDKNLADNFWPGENALNKCIIVGPKTWPCRRVVGIVAASHFEDFIEEPTMHYYMPTAQWGDEARNIIIRTDESHAKAVGAAVSRELAQMYGTWARPNVRTMETVLARKLRPWRTGAATFSAAGLLALLVAAVGIYSSISYAITQRTQELGVRVALGASAPNIVKLVLGEGVQVVAFGIVAGVGLALMLGRLVEALLYEVSPRDPLILIGAALTLLTATVIACLIPAWRASRVDPLTAMRAE